MKFYRPETFALLLLAFYACHVQGQSLESSKFSKKFNSQLKNLEGELDRKNVIALNADSNRATIVSMERKILRSRILSLTEGGPYVEADVLSVAKNPELFSEALLRREELIKVYSIYEEDNRLDLKMATVKQKELARSVCLIVLKSAVTFSGNEIYMDTVPFTFSGNTPAPSVNFRNQRVVPIESHPNTGFLMKQGSGPSRQLITAFHSISTEKKAAPQERFYIFGYDDTCTVTNGRIRLETNQIYEAKPDLIQNTGERDIDIAIVELTRPVTFEGASGLSLDPSTAIPNNVNVGMIGHPIGMSVKVAFGKETRITDNKANYSTFTTNVDAFRGNSGSPILDAKENRVWGVHVASAGDYNLVAGQFDEDRVPHSNDPRNVEFKIAKLFPNSKPTKFPEVSASTQLQLPHRASQ